MEQKEFLAKIVDLLQTGEEITMDTNLSTLEEWDSLSMMAVASFLTKQFDKKVTYVDIKGVKTVADIFAKANS